VYVLKTITLKFTPEL